MAKTSVAKAGASAAAKPQEKAVPVAEKTASVEIKNPPAAEKKAKKTEIIVEAPAGKADANGAKKTAAESSKAKANPEIKEKQKKPKLVRDSFTMPETEYAVLGEVKKACLKAGVEVKKSELLRVGVALVRELDIARLKEVLASLPTLKAGRPKKSK